MRHIHGFFNGRARDLRDLTNLTQEGSTTTRYQLEVILSDAQTRDDPALVAELARLGYVYTSSWSGNHETPVHLFLRAHTRLALSDAHFYNRWVNDLNGQLPHPDLGGVLPPIGRHRGILVGRRLPMYNYLLAGDRVRVDSPMSQFNGRVATIVRFTEDYNTGGMRAVIDLRTLLGNEGEISVNNLVRIDEQPAAGQAALQHRHPNFEELTFFPLREAPPAQLEPRRLILSQFYCIFRDSGNASRVFATLEEGTRAFPRATEWHERKIYSDGEIVEGPVNHG
jgi:hypothetical protein